MSKIKPCPFCGSTLSPFGRDYADPYHPSKDDTVKTYKHPMVKMNGLLCPLSDLIFREDTWNTRFKYTED